MATLANAINGSKLHVRLGDGATSELFVHPCTINTNRGIEFSSSPVETQVPYCPPDEELPGWIERAIDGLTASITGAGILDTGDLDTFWNWFTAGTSKNIHVEVDTTGALGGGYWSGAAVLSGFTVTGPGRREKTTFECTILSDGVWSWVAAA